MKMSFLTDFGIKHPKSYSGGLVRSTRTVTGASPSTGYALSRLPVRIWNHRVYATPIPAWNTSESGRKLAWKFPRDTHQEWSLFGR